jgi:5'-3' exonuclease
MTVPMPLVLDADSLIKRCVFASALDDLKAGGIFTGGVYGSLNVLRAFLDTPEGHFVGPIFACFDAGIPPKRLQLLPDYKSKRAEKKKLLSEAEKKKAFEQIGLTRQMFKALGVKTLGYKEREADDVVGAVVKVCLKHIGPPVVMTGDRDLWQTVAWGARVWDLNKKRWINEDNFVEITGLEPSTYLLYKALVGDASDSIVGCPGCGEKRAKALIAEAMEKIKTFESMPTQKQLNVLRDIVAHRPNPKKYEKALYENCPYLRKVIEATDLSRSFGGTTMLLKGLSEFDARVRKLDFLRLCKTLNFQSVIAGPDRYTRPFGRAAAKWPESDE